MIGRITSSSVTEALVDAQASQMEGWDAVMSITGAVVGAVDGAVAVFADSRDCRQPWDVCSLVIVAVAGSGLPAAKELIVADFSALSTRWRLLALALRVTRK